VTYALAYVPVARPGYFASSIMRMVSRSTSSAKGLNASASGKSPSRAVLVDGDPAGEGHVDRHVSREHLKRSLGIAHLQDLARACEGVPRLI
jgi:hypothetical protein